MTTPNQAGNAHRILVVDDDPISLQLVALLLGSEGHLVTSAANGIDALEALAHCTFLEQPNTILVDLKMSGLSGEELARRLRSQAGSGVRILAMSATAPSSIGFFDGFLLKPLSVDLLSQLLNEGNPRGAMPAWQPAGNEAGSEAGNLGVLDESVFRRLQSMMPPSSVREIFGACIGDARKRLPEMAQFVNAGDSVALRAAAHTIKGGSSMIGASRLAQVAARIENGMHALDVNRQLLKELSSACDELDRILLERVT